MEDVYHALLLLFLLNANLIMLAAIAAAFWRPKRFRCFIRWSNNMADTSIVLGDAATAHLIINDENGNPIEGAIPTSTSWTLVDSGIATIFVQDNSTAILRAVEEGQATLAVTAQYGGQTLSATAVVTVTPAVTGDLSLSIAWTAGVPVPPT